jgi:hypothetical protein
MTTERGTEIQRRLDALGISDREFREETGIDRKTLRRAVNAEERVRPSTYAAIESALDKLEREVGIGAPTPQLSGAGTDLIEFDVSSEGGFHVVVKGPVKDADALRAPVTAFIREMSQELGNTPQTH